jgi:DNA polymerase-3 subunit gamma/tau
MSYQVLARKWRPRDFASMVGQTHVVRALANALDGDRVHHAFLFTGTRGVGKTTIARVLAKCLNCEQGVGSTPCGECGACTEIDEGRFVDLIEVDAASRSKVDETRELMDNVQFVPTRGRYKVYLIDEVHMFSEKSFNALLKTLEEPPPHVKFLLATTDPQKLPITVLSRCLQFNLKRLPAESIADHLQHILEAETVPAEGSAARLLARAADGSMRDALSLLDQAIAFGAGELREDEVRAMLGTLDQRHVLGLLEGLADGEAAALLGRIETMAGDVTDFAEALAELLGELQRIAVLQVVPDGIAADDDGAEARRALAARLAPEDVQLFYQVGLHARRDLPLAPDPRGGFEMALLRMLAFRPAPAPARGGAGDGGVGAARVDAVGVDAVDAGGGGVEVSGRVSPAPPAARPRAGRGRRAPAVAPGSQMQPAGVGGEAGDVAGDAAGDGAGIRGRIRSQGAAAGRAARAVALARDGGRARTRRTRARARGELLHGRHRGRAHRPRARAGARAAQCAGDLGQARAGSRRAPRP